jgi:adenosylmethionine-8-amino-7-oxononanoate aminotransferase
VLAIPSSFYLTNLELFVLNHQARNFTMTLRTDLPPMLYPYARPTATEFLRIVRGCGASVFDDDGRDYIDATSALWFCTVGHGRVEIADAVRDQMVRLAAFHAFERYSNDTTEELAQLLVDDAPLDNARVFFTNSGSEAADTAIKIVRAARSLSGTPERSMIVGITGAFHGVSYAGISVGGIQLNKTHFGKTLPDTVSVKRNDLVALEAVFRDYGSRVAAFIVEPVPAAAGVYPPSPGYLLELRVLCDKYGVWLIFDEVVTGFGRLGTMWGSRYFGVEADLVMFAKGVTSGYIPLGGVFVGPRVREYLESDVSFLLRHGHTYSGHPAACAAALSNINILRTENLIAEVPRISARIKDGLHEIASDGLVKEVRGDGAMWAVELRDGMDAVKVRELMVRSGRVLVRAIGESTVAISPPFVTSDDQLDRCVDSLRRAIVKLS